MEMQKELQSIHYSSPCNQIEETFRIMAFSSVGRRVLKEFLPLLSRGEIQIRSLDPKVSMEVVSGSSLTGTPAAGFVFDGSKKIIYIESHTALGLLTPLLFHEIVHSIDEDYLSSYFQQERLWAQFRARSRIIFEDVKKRNNKNLSELNTDHLLPEELDEIQTLKEACERFDQVRLFVAERKAYTELYVFVEDLCKNMPGYSHYIGAQEERGYVLNRPITDEEIVQGYRLNRRYV